MSDAYDRDVRPTKARDAKAAAKAAKAATKAAKTKAVAKDAARWGRCSYDL